MHLIKKPFRVAAVGCGLATLILSFGFGTSMAEAGVDDQLGHLVAYAAIAFFAYFGWSGRLRGYHILALLVVVGGIIEVLQGLTGRTPSWSDWAADGVGAFAGVTFAALVKTIDQVRRARSSAADKTP